MRERTVTISGASKTFSVTGWRIGWIIAPGRAHRRDPEGARLPDRRRAGAAAGRRGGGARRAGPPRSTTGSPTSYRARRDLLHGALVEAGLPLRCAPRAPTTSWPTSPTWPTPAAAARPPLDDTAFAVWLSREVGVTPVPGSSFFRDGGGGRSLVRFVFCKTEDMLTEAARRLRLHRARRPRRPAGRKPAVAERAPAVSRGARRGHRRDRRHRAGVLRAAGGRGYDLLLVARDRARLAEAGGGARGGARRRRPRSSRPTSRGDDDVDPAGRADRRPRPASRCWSTTRGSAPAASWPTSDPAKQEAMVRLHTLAPMRLTRAALPVLLARTGAGADRQRLLRRRRSSTPPAT